MYKKRSILVKTVALLMIVVFLCPTNVLAVEPRASDYLNSYSAYVYPAGWYKVQVWISVTGTVYMDEIGSLNIWLYESEDNENWSLVKTYRYVDYPDMMGYDDYIHTGHVEYAGTIGHYYKAYVCVWAGKDGEGDTRYFWTSPVKATLFAG